MDSPKPNCHCDVEANEVTVVKAGENKGRKFLTCSQSVWDKATSSRFGGCKFFHWSDAPTVLCSCGKIKTVGKTGNTFCSFCYVSTLEPVIQHIKKNAILSAKLNTPNFMCECYTDNTCGAKTVFGRTMIEIFCKKGHEQRAIIAFANTEGTKKLNARIAPRLVMHVDEHGIVDVE